MMHMFLRLAPFMGLLACLHAAEAGAIHVPADHATIQAAVDAAVDGDDILVAPGVHNGTVRIAGKSLTIASTGDSQDTFIRGGFMEQVIRVDSNPGDVVTISGFTLEEVGASSSMLFFIGGGELIATDVVAQGLLLDPTIGISVRGSIGTLMSCRAEGVSGGFRFDQGSEVDATDCRVEGVISFGFLCSDSVCQLNDCHVVDAVDGGMSFGGSSEGSGATDCSVTNCAISTTSDEVTFTRCTATSANLQSAFNGDDCVMEGCLFQSAQTFFGFFVTGDRSVIRNSEFSGNAEGLRVVGSDALIEGCVISDNTECGMSIRLGTGTTVRACTLERNEGEAAIQIEADDTRVEDCTLHENGVSTSIGNGIRIEDADQIEIVGTTISASICQIGSLLHVINCPVLTVDRCRIVDTTIGTAGIELENSNALIMSSLIADNDLDEAAICIDGLSAASVHNVTIPENRFAPAIAAEPGAATVKVFNSILRTDRSLTGVIEDPGGRVSASFSNVEGGWPGASNIDVDPLFVRTFGRMYELDPASPCRDIGNRFDLPGQSMLDLNGCPRLADSDGSGGAEVNMGAFEGGVLVVASGQSIQAAMDAADGCTSIVHIESGFYMEDLVMDTALALVGIDGPATTLVIGNGGVPLSIEEDISGAVVRGLTLAGGTSPDMGGGVRIGSGTHVSAADLIVRDNFAAVNGGGIGIGFGGSLSLTDSVVRNNECNMRGGGVSIVGGGVTLVGCEFRENRATMTGGAVDAELAQVTLFESMFEDNEAASAAGVRAVGSGRLFVTDCSFTGHHATGAGGAFFAADQAAFGIFDSEFNDNSASDGGALRILGGGDHTLIGCSFDGNAATDDGGAILLEDATGEFYTETCRFTGNSGERGGAVRVANAAGATMYRARFLGNDADGWGGAISCTMTPDLTIAASILADNMAFFGGAILLDGGDLRLWHCTLDDNNTTALISGQASHGGGGVLEVRDSIVFNGNSFDLHTAPGATLDVERSNIEDATPGVGNISAPPLYVDGAGRDFRLRPGSPGIDAAGLAAPWIDVDIDGLARIINGQSDMGAHETPCTGDVNGDGSIDFADLNELLDQWGNSVTPGTVGDVDYSGVVNFADLEILLEAWGLDCLG